MFPWSLLALATFIPNSGSGRLPRIDRLPSMELGYLYCWALFPLLFFSFARNILWTYVLPALPALAIVLALAITRARSELTTRVGFAIAIGVPLLATFIAALAIRHPERLKTERDLVAQTQKKREKARPLIYVNSRPFSARFYSEGMAKVMSLEEVEQAVQKYNSGIYFAVPKDLVTTFERRFEKTMIKEFVNRRFVLYETVPTAQDLAVKYE